MDDLVVTTALRLRAKASWRTRRCFVCQQTIPSGAGIQHLDLGILVHAGACGAVADAERRVYDRSRRGRLRSRREVLARVVADACAPAAANLLRELDVLESADA